MTHTAIHAAGDLGSPGGHVDITPLGCDLFATPSETARCSDVVFLNASASPAQLLGLAYGRCRELAMLANLAGSRDASESELRQCLEHLWIGLDTVVVVLDRLGHRMGEV